MRRFFGKTYFGVIVVAAVLLAVTGFTIPARADWNPGDPYKMHYPQLPDPLGWDVNFASPKVLADDWLCTETGPVSDIHLWFSSQADQSFTVDQIRLVHLSIHADVPAGSVPFSQPGVLLWQADLLPGQFSVRPYGTGEEGWYDPNTGYWQKPDHFQYYQLNIVDIPDPLIQQQGIIYWLDVSVQAVDVHLGWKTSLQHFKDDAVWTDVPTSANWQELYDPITGQSLDLAFVITPEPGTVTLVGLGVVGLLTVIRRKKA
ncbi:MAG TPA: PEP-CTERM sorting domain-containing protein [Verrucomicrobiae bacterium]|nr:PEP-CTERM sorting domain-containing protein [Verrucomicrobiae bacterium]